MATYNTFMKFLSPTLWFYVLVASLPFTRIPSALIYGVHVRPSLIIGAIFIFLVFSKNPKVFLPQHRALQILYAFLAVCTISALMSQSPSHSLIVTAYTLFTVLIAVAIVQIFNKLNVQILVKVLCFSALISALFGLYQFMGDLLGLSSVFTGLRHDYSVHVFGFPRVQSTALEPLYYANYLLFPISILIALGVFFRRPWLLGIGLVTTLLLTLSRGGVAALFIMALAWIVLLITKKRYQQIGIMGAVGTASILLTILALTYIVPRLYKDPVQKPALTAYSDQITNYELGDFKADRSYTRHTALVAFKENPWLGVGPGNFGRYINAKDARYPNSQIVNNEPYELLAETGAIGSGVFLAFVLVIGVSALRQFRRTESSIVWLGWGLLLYLFAVGVQYYSFSTLYIVHIWVAIGLLMGLTRSLKLNVSKV